MIREDFLQICSGIFQKSTMPEHPLSIKEASGSNFSGMGPSTLLTLYCSRKYDSSPVSYVAVAY